MQFVSLETNSFLSLKSNSDLIDQMFHMFIQEDFMTGMVVLYLFGSKASTDLQDNYLMSSIFL